MQDKFESLIQQLESAIEFENLELAQSLDKQVLEEIKITDETVLNENVTYLQSLVERHRRLINNVDLKKKQAHKNISQFSKNQKNLKKYQNV
jgi:hypothetical protein